MTDSRYKKIKVWWYYMTKRYVHIYFQSPNHTDRFDNANCLTMQNFEFSVM